MSIFSDMGIQDAVIEKTTVEEIPCPQVLCACGERASTKRIATVTVEVLATAGELSVTLYESLDDEDRGGVVIEVEAEGDYRDFVPVVVETDRGVQLHVAGDGEAKALLTALRYLLAAKRADRGEIGSIKINEAQ